MHSVVSVFLFLLWLSLLRSVLAYLPFIITYFLFDGPSRVPSSSLHHHPFLHLECPLHIPVSEAKPELAVTSCCSLPKWWLQQVWPQLFFDMNKIKPSWLPWLVPSVLTTTQDLSHRTLLAICDSVSWILVADTVKFPRIEAFVSKLSKSWDWW